MTRNRKIAIVAAFALSLLASWGVYWWHEASLDRLAQEHRLYEGVALDDIEKALAASPTPDKVGAEKRLKALDPDEQVLLLHALSNSTRAPSRAWAATQLAPYRDRPLARAALARVATADPDGRAREAAKKALGD